MVISDLFIRRPVFAIVVNALLAALGLYALNVLSVRDLPAFEAPLATITTTLAGASAQLMETEVTSRVEEAISGAHGVDYFTSTSASGTSTVTVTFRVGVRSSDAVADVRARVEAVRPQFPPNTQSPIVAPMSLDAVPVLYVSLSSPTRMAMELTELIDKVVRTPLSTLEGVASVALMGERKYAMRIELDPLKMAALEITPEDVRRTVLQQSAAIAAGTVVKGDLRIDVLVDTTLSTAKAFRRLIVRGKNDYLIRLEDIARVVVAADDVRTGVLVDGQPGLTLGVLRQAGANALTIAKQVHAALPALQAALPSDVTAEVIFDTTEPVRESIDELFVTLRDAVGLVIVVVMLFLGSIRASLVTVVTIPLSLIGTLAFMLVMGYSLNTFSLLAIVLSVGLVVDDAIVDVENVQRHIARGLDPMTASFVGSREIGFAVIATTLTLAAVYLPMGFLPGLIGALFQEFAFTLAAAVVISGFISRTLSPMMCSRLLRPAKPQRPGKRGPMRRTEDAYRWVLEAALCERWAVFAVFLAVGVVAVAAARTLPTELAPDEDLGFVMASLVGAPGTSYETLEQRGREIAGVFDTVPEKTRSLILLGQPDYRSGFAVLILKPVAGRGRSAAAISAALAPALKAIPGIEINLVPAGVLSGGGQLPIQMAVKAPGDYRNLAATMEKIQAAAAKIPGVDNPQSNLQFNTPQLQIAIDRDVAGDTGVAAALGDYRVGTFSYDAKNYNIIVELDGAVVTQQEGVGLALVRNSRGNVVPLRQMVTTLHSVEADRLAHFNGVRSAMLTAGIAPGASLGPTLDALEAAVRPLLPPGATLDFDGPSRQLKAADASAGLVFLMSFLAIYGFLAAQFESFRDPVIILLVVPFSVLGSLFGLAEAGGSINLFSGIGLITLVGLVAKQGILVTEFANQLRDEGRELRAAVIEAAVTRLRPVLMTVWAMVVGTLPLLYNHGSGAQGRMQIGVVVIGGMILGMLLALFVVPATYTLLSKRVRKPLATPPGDDEARRLLHGQFDPVGVQG